jgi:polyhydroxybutyrate depolymerase
MVRSIAAVLVVAILAAVVIGHVHRPTPLGAGLESPAPSGTTTYSFAHDGQTRVYNLHVPPSLDRAVAVPLVVELHGGGGSGDNIDGLTGFYALADRTGFVVAAPSGLGKSWNDGRLETSASSGGADDVGFLSEMIDRIAGQVAIDRGRVYVAGISNGAIMAGRLACELPDRFAAVAQVAGTASVQIAARCNPGRPIPILEIHGTADPLVPYSGGTVAAQFKGGRGQVVGVDQWASYWVANNADIPEAQVSSLGSDTTVRAWRGNSPQSDVIFYRVDGAGHTWPGGKQYLPKLLIGTTTRSFDATTTIWQFFAGHRSA